MHGLCGNGTLEAGLTVPPRFSYSGGTPGGIVGPGVGRPPSCGDSAGPSRSERRFVEPLAPPSAPCFRNSALGGLRRAPPVCPTAGVPQGAHSVWEWGALAYAGARPSVVMTREKNPGLHDRNPG